MKFASSASINKKVDESAVLLRQVRDSQNFKGSEVSKEFKHWFNNMVGPQDPTNSDYSGPP